MNSRARQSGFTLLELLASIAVFSMLVAMLFQLVKGGLDVWTLGEQGKEATEKASLLLDQITTDLRMARAEAAPGMPEAPVRMLADHHALDFDLDQVDESTVQVMRFVRSLPEERFDPRVRESGDVPIGVIPGEEATVESARQPAAGGMAEILYTTAKLPIKGADPAALVLVRGMRFPVVGAGSLCALDLPDDDKKFFRMGSPLAEGVLYLGFEFWGRDTTSFDIAHPNEGAAFTTWDSTRALLLEKESLNTFPLALSKSSLNDADDDVFPRRVRVTLVLERDADDALDIQLLEDLSPSTTSLRMQPMRLLDRGSNFKYLKIGGEWIEWTEIRGDEVTIIRGVRNTEPTAHRLGTKIHIGTTYQRTIDIPVYRENWNDP